MKKNRAIKVNQTSKYWSDFEAELCVFYHFKWIGENAINIFENKKYDFINKYINITRKNGIAEPTNFIDKKKFILDFENYLTKKKSVIHKTIIYSIIYIP